MVDDGDGGGHDPRNNTSVFDCILVPFFFSSVQASWQWTLVDYKMV